MSDPASPYHPATLQVLLTLDASQPQPCACGCGQTVPKIGCESNLDGCNTESLVRLLGQLAMMPKLILGSMLARGDIPPEKYTQLVAQVNRETLSLMACAGGGTAAMPVPQPPPAPAANSLASIDPALRSVYRNN